MKSTTLASQKLEPTTRAADPTHPGYESVAIRNGLIAVAAVFFLLMPESSAAGGTPVGGQFQINTYTTGGQYRPEVALDQDGDFVVVWQSDGSSGSDSSQLSVQGQRYASDGTAAGGEFQVNTHTVFDQLRPVVALDWDGDFVIVWQSGISGGSDSSRASIQGRRYGAGGTPIGGQFQVNTYTTDRQIYPSVAIAPDGAFVVVWRSEGSGGSDSSDESVQGQRYASNGMPIGGQFQINTYTTNLQFNPTVAMDQDGNFVVVWGSDGSGGSDTSQFSVQGQRYASDGMPIDDQFQVNSYTTDRQSFPSVAMDADGDFVVVWNMGGEDYDVRGQRYASDGTAIGCEFQVNTYTTDQQSSPSVTMGENGDFAVVWSSRGSSGSDSLGGSVQGQRYASDGTAVGGEFQVNAYTTNGQGRSSVALDADGDFVVVWESFGSGETDSWYGSIQGQHFSPIFADGFESGDTSAWN